MKQALNRFQSTPGAVALVGGGHGTGWAQVRGSGQDAAPALPSARSRDINERWGMPALCSTTTMRTYTAWVSEADQGAATGLAARMPARLTAATPAQRMAADLRSPCERFASTLAAEIGGGASA